MIRDYAQACAVLGVSPDASKDVIKKAYRNLLKQLHPDAHPTQTQMVKEAYFLVKEAYAYIEKYQERSGDPSMSNTGRILGSPLGKHTSTAESVRNKQRFEEEYRRRKQKHKEELKEELKQRQDELARSKKEREILNEIRMIRLAQAIRMAMSGYGEETK